MKTKLTLKQKPSKKALLIILCSVLLLAVLSVLLILQPWSKKPAIINIGLPTEESYAFSTSPRNPWDMIIADGNLYIGAGDYGSNSGPTSIWRYNIEERKWALSSMVPDEAISKFVVVDGEIMAPGIDSTKNSSIGNFHRLAGTEWETIDNISDAAHNYDIIKYDGKTLFGIGTKNGTSDIFPVKSTVDFETYENVPFYRDGESIRPADVLSYFRVYDFFPINGELYCLLAAKYENVSSTVWEFYKYDDGEFHFVSEYGDLVTKSENLWMDPLGSKAEFDGEYYFTTGYLYKTEDFTQAEQLSTPDNGFVTDLWVEKGGFLKRDAMYILSAAEKENGGYQNTVWKYTSNGKMKKVASFSAGTTALSLTKDKNCFFVGLGNYHSDHDDVGRILKIEY